MSKNHGVANMENIKTIVFLGIVVSCVKRNCGHLEESKQRREMERKIVPPSHDDQTRVKSLNLVSFDTLAVGESCRN
ncbi:hypothetical protein MRB53_016341 [Persea americana]|uniref:Uncharacterized protein n=1 Tax=Persea americana TaxID=3435 RepID=A0ACC2M387_PERAE|nr:hypothetical protein MRB53_016341 [Persea americana]